MVVLKRKNLKTFFDSNNPEELQIIKDALTFNVPGAHWSKKYKKNQWDGKKKFYSTKDYFWFGNIERVLEALSNKRVRYKVFGYKERNQSDITFSKNFLSEDRDYQRLSIKEIFRLGYGIIKVPTRGGKTFIASEIIRIYNPQKCLFLTDSSDIFNQVPNDIKKINKGVNIGEIKGEKFDLEKINIGMIQTFQSIFSSNKTKEQRLKRKIALDLLKSVDLLIIDEIHEFSSNKRLSIVKKCDRVDMVVALSATPEKDTGIIHKVSLESITGGITYEIAEETLVKKGVLAQNKVLMILNKIPSFDDYQDSIKQGIILNHKRNSMLMRMIQICKELNLKTLVVFKFVAHGEYFSRVLNIPFASGVNKQQERSDYQEDFLNSEGGVMLASLIWKKGITLPEVEVLINVVGGKESSLTLQIRGRVLGVTDSKKKALCIDFFDEQEGGYLEEHSEKRIKTYNSTLPWESIDFIDFQGADFESNFRNYLRDFLK